MITNHGQLKPAGLSHARLLASHAHRQRFIHLSAIAQGELTPTDVIHAACAEDGKYLRKLTLVRILAVQPGWGERPARQAVSRLAEVAGLKVRLRKIDIAWLIDPRAGGRRLAAWASVADTSDHKPWPGFPFAADPSAVAA